MSDDYHRPTLTFPSGAYNATQVRLYGIRPDLGLSVQGQPATLGDTGIRVETTPKGGVKEDDLKRASDILGKGEKIRDKGEKYEYFRKVLSGETTIPGVPVHAVYYLNIQTKKFGDVVITIKNPLQILGKSDTRALMSCGIIVGYAYEGHTYDLPKPKIMMIPALPESKIPDDDSGYNLKEKEGYAVWFVDKLDECVELEMNQGFVEQLVLEANLPGKRSPTMYAGRMMLGHRSGRLTE